jgi:hypothetical protein
VAGACHDRRVTAVTAELSEYEIRRLVEHLHAAANGVAVRRLLRLENAEDGGNAWFAAQDALRNVDGYLRDLRLARELAEPRELGLGARCAMMLSSVRSASASVPPELLARAVKEGVRTIDEALAQVERAMEPRLAAETLIAVAPYAPAARHAELRLLTARIGDDGERARAIVGLAGTLASAEAPELLAEIARLAPSLEDHLVGQAVVELAPRVGRPYAPRLRALAGRVTSGALRAEALLAVAPIVDRGDRPAILDEASDIRAGLVRDAPAETDDAADVVRPARASLRGEGQRAVADATERWRRVELMLEAVAHADDREAVDTALHLDAHASPLVADAVASLAPHLPVADLQVLLAGVAQLSPAKRGRVLPAVAESVPAQLHPTILELAATLEVDDLRRTVGAYAQRIAPAHLEAMLQLCRPIGKTAIMSRFVLDRAGVHHFNVAPLGTRSPHAFLANVCAQLIVRYGLPHESLPPDATQDGGFLARLLAEAAQEDANRPVVVAVDALEEAEHVALPPGTNRLFLPPTLPAGVWFVVSTREEAQARLYADPTIDIYVRDDDPRNLADVRGYITGFIEASRERMQGRIDEWGVDEPAFVDILTEKSGAAGTPRPSRRWPSRTCWATGGNSSTSTS